MSRNLMQIYSMQLGLYRSRFFNIRPLSMLPNTDRRPTEMEKKILVFMGRYKKDEIPEFVTYETMHATRSRLRLRIANYMAGASVIGFIFMIMWGKRDAEAGKTWQNTNIEWHKKIKDEHDQKMLNENSSK